MPRAFARALTAASNGLGTRMLICSSFFSNSNRAGLNCEKSRSDRSCARNASASLSVLSLGTFFFIGCNLLRVHIAGRHGADETAAVFRPYGEGDKHRPPSAGSSHGNHAVLVVRVLRVWRDAGSVHEQCLNLHDGNAMLLALRTVAAVPVKSLHPQIHHSMKLCKCIYKCQEQFSGGICHRGRLRAPEWCPASPDKRCGRGKPLTDPRQPIFLSTYTLRFRLILKTWWPGKE